MDKEFKINDSLNIITSQNFNQFEFAFVVNWMEKPLQIGISFLFWDLLVEIGKVPEHNPSSL